MKPRDVPCAEKARSISQRGAKPGKALGGGVLPIAAVLARADLDVGGAWAFGHYTHEKNPVTCRAALTTLDIIEDEGLVENARRQRERTLQRLWEMRERQPLIGVIGPFGPEFRQRCERTRSGKVSG